MDMGVEEDDPDAAGVEDATKDSRYLSRRSNARFADIGMIVGAQRMKSIAIPTFRDERYCRNRRTRARSAPPSRDSGKRDGIAYVMAASRIRTTASIALRHPCSRKPTSSSSFSTSSRCYAAPSPDKHYYVTTPIFYVNAGTLLALLSRHRLGVSRF